MQRNKLFQITYENDIYYLILYQTNKDIVNCISNYLFKGYTLNNSTYDYIQQLQTKTYVFNDFEYNIFKTLDYFDYIHSNLMRIKLCEMLYRYINRLRYNFIYRFDFVFCCYIVNPRRILSIYYFS